MTSPGRSSTSLGCARGLIVRLKPKPPLCLTSTRSPYADGFSTRSAPLQPTEHNAAHVGRHLAACNLANRVHDLVIYQLRLHFACAGVLRGEFRMRIQPTIGGRAGGHALEPARVDQAETVGDVPADTAREL